MSDTNEETEVDLEEKTEAEQPVDQISQDEELSQYGEKVRERIAKETAKRGAVERELASLQERLEVTARIAQHAVEENKHLKQGRVDSDQAILDNLVDKMSAELDIAKRVFREASESGEAEKIADATALVATTAADLRRVQLAKAGYRPPQEDRGQSAPNQPAPQSQKQPPAKAVEWVNRNSTWYGKDPVRTRIARAADVYVAAMGYNPEGEEYYKEVDKMIAERTNGAANGSERDQGSSLAPVAPSGRSSAPSRPSGSKVTLSQSEVSQAKRLGVSPEAYAAAKRAGNVVI
jgi:hypothetical protein